MSWPIGITIGNLKRREQYMASNKDFIARPVSSDRDGADSNLDVARSKWAVSQEPHDADLSKKNVEKARRERWSSTSGPSHTPSE
jgi:hypothetical protein